MFVPPHIKVSTISPTVFDSTSCGYVIRQYFIIFECMNAIENTNSHFTSDHKKGDNHIDQTQKMTNREYRTLCVILSPTMIADEHKQN